MASNIESLQVKQIAYRDFGEFSIVKSSNESEEITEVSPDIAVCSECLIDMRGQENRLDFPFINCTNCGPRFTIIRDIPS